MPPQGQETESSKDEEWTNLDMTQKHFGWNIKSKL